jgi:hypothetical protein
MVIFLTSLFIVLCLVLAVKMTVEQHQAIYNVVTTLAVIGMIAVVAIYFGICLSRCWDICSDYLSTGVVGAMAIPSRLARAISEIGYGLSETSHGHGPKARRVYKARASKIQRKLDAIEIAEGLEDVVPAESDYEWTEFDEDYALSLCSREDEINEMWSQWQADQWTLSVAVTDYNQWLQNHQLSAMFALNKQIETESMWHNYEQGGE